MRRMIPMALVSMMLACASFPAALSSSTTRMPSDEAAAFEAAGFSLVGEQWRSCDHDDNESVYGPGRISQVRDINGDGLPEAIVSEDSVFCYGMVGTAFVLVSKRPDGGWSGMIGDRGIPRFLETKGEDGWPDLQIGGPGFCFPVLRWNGERYALHRHEYDGEACEPGPARNPHAAKAPVTDEWVRQPMFDISGRLTSTRRARFLNPAQPSLMR